MRTNGKPNVYKKINKKKIARAIYYSVLIFLLLATVYFRNNAGFLYSLIGNYYYNHNNIPQAQKFYEKSFNAGYNNAETREIYVNSIINFPLTIDGQEKLVQLAEGDKRDAASGKARAFLYDLMLEIHKNYPENYINHASYNKKIIHWNSLPITYTYKNPENAPKEYISEIDAAFNEWDKATSHKVIFLKTTESDANIVIEFIQKKTEEVEYGKKYIVAYTTPVITGNTLEKMIIKISVTTPDGKIYTPNQIYNTALHEIFHSLGYMGHSSNPENIMYMSKDNILNERDEKDHLNTADTSTLELLYNTKPDITNEGNMIYKYVPYLVLGDDEYKNISKNKEANNYIRKAPNLPNGYIDLAESFVGEGKYSQAIKALDKALFVSETNDEKYVVYYNLAVSYYYIGHYEMALDYVKYAEELNSNDELKVLKAEIYIKQHKEKEAIKEYSELIAKYPNNMDYTISLINIYIKNHDYLKARYILKNYKKNNPSKSKDKRFEPYGILNW